MLNKYVTSSSCSFLRSVKLYLVWNLLQVLGNSEKAREITFTGLFCVGSVPIILLQTLNLLTHILNCFLAPVFLLKLLCFIILTLNFIQEHGNDAIFFWCLWEAAASIGWQLIKGSCGLGETELANYSLFF